MIDDETDDLFAREIDFDFVFHRCEGVKKKIAIFRFDVSVWSNLLADLD
jgi:hypothetical protein